MEWKSTAAFAPAIPLLDLAPLRRPRDLPQDVLVKDSTTRTVARVRDPLAPDGPGLYVKRDKFRDLTDNLRHVLTPSKCRIEWRMSGALTDADIRTCNVLAYAVRRHFGVPVEGFAVSREIPGVRPLAGLVREVEGQAMRELVQELAAVTARLAANGFYHRDYHVGNIVARPDAPAGQRVYVLDLHSVRRRKVRGRHVQAMLTMLGHSAAARGVPGAQQEAFLRMFLAQWRTGSVAGEEAFQRWRDGLSMGKRRYHRERIRSRTKRCVKESSLFTCDNAEGLRIWRRRDFPVQSAIAAVEAHRRAVAGGRDNRGVFRNGRQGGRTELTVVPCDAVPPCGPNQPVPPQQVTPGRVCVKAFRRDAWIERLKDVLRPRGRARAAWMAHRMFKVAGVPAPRPLALLEARSKLSGRPDYLVVEALENDGDLFAYTATRELSQAQRTALGRAVAALLNRLAEEEIYHPDTKPTNILVREKDGGYRLWLVDLDRACHGRPLGRERWVKMLARVNAGLPSQITLLDRMRVLRRCAQGRWSAQERQEVARRALELSIQRRPKWRVVRRGEPSEGAGGSEPHSAQ